MTGAEGGQTFVEYALVLALIAIVAAAAMATDIGPTVADGLASLVALF